MFIMGIFVSVLIKIILYTFENNALILQNCFITIAGKLKISFNLITFFLQKFLNCCEILISKTYDAVEFQALIAFF